MTSNIFFIEIFIYLNVKNLQSPGNHNNQVILIDIVPGKTKNVLKSNLN